jgi:hypothetical protein
MLSADVNMGRGRQLPLDCLGMVKGDGVVRAMLVMSRGDRKEGYGRERGQEGAVVAKE